MLVNSSPFSIGLIRAAILFRFKIKSIDFDTCSLEDSLKGEIQEWVFAEADCLTIGGFLVFSWSIILLSYKQINDTVKHN